MEVHNPEMKKKQIFRFKRSHNKCSAIISKQIIKDISRDILEKLKNGDQGKMLRMFRKKNTYQLEKKN